MQKDPHNKLVTYTALAIIAQQNTGQIQKIRIVNDPAYQRWQPHINICFPFVHPDNFQQTFNKLQLAFKGFKQFEITFREMDCFPHGTVFLVPETLNKGSQIGQIYERVVKALPECKAEREFYPHMTVGKFNKQNVNVKKQYLAKNWKQWKIKCKGLHMIRREKDTPFRTEMFVKFQPSV